MITCVGLRTRSKFINAKKMYFELCSKFFFEMFSGSQLYNLINLNSLFWKNPLGFSETGCNMLVVVHVPTGLD